MLLFDIYEHWSQMGPKFSSTLKYSFCENQERSYTTISGENVLVIVYYLPKIFQISSAACYKDIEPES